MGSQFQIWVEGQDQAESGRMADDLRMSLIEADPAATVEQTRCDESTMDPGTILAVILGTPSAIVLAKAVLKWAGRNNAVRLSLRTETGEVVAQNLESKDVPAIVAAFASASKN